MFFSSLFDDDPPRSFFGRTLFPQPAAAETGPLPADSAPATPGDQVAEAPLDPRYAKFFSDNYAYAARVGAKYGVDPTLPLGIAALESGYGTGNLAKQRNNPLGMRLDSYTSTAFPSIAAAWDAWGREFGPRVLGVGGDVATFLDRLQEDDRNVYGPVPGGRYIGAYNSTNPNWKHDVAGTIRGVQKRLPLWQGSSDDAP